MCWISYNIPVKKIATEDITCYKLFARESIVWKKRKFWFYSQKIIERFTSLCIAYIYIPYKENPKINLTCLQERDWMWDKIYHWNIEEGYHSYATLSKVKRYINVCSNHYYIIVKCIIPKGSEYYINDKEEIVSSNIIVTDKIIR